MNALAQFFPDFVAVRRPTFPLPFGGLLTVKTFATNEIQVRVANNISSLHRRDIHRVVRGAPKREARSLVLCAISQTDVESGEVMGTPRSRRFTTGARHTIREAAAVLGSEHGKRIWFITLTLPGQHISAIEKFAEFDTEIKNAYLQNFRKLWKKLYPLRLFAAEYCIVSELQKNGAIHFHIAIAWHEERFRKLVKKCYRFWWWKLLKHYSIKTGVNLLENAHGWSLWDKPGELMVECEQVKKSVECYLSKYLSKCVSKAQQASVNTPSRWWSISSSLRRKTYASRHSESFVRITFDEAIEQVETVAQIAADAGLEIKPMVNFYNGSPLGFVLFCEPEKKGLFYEWFRTIVREGVKISSKCLFPSYERKMSVGFG